MTLIVRFHHSIDRELEDFLKTYVYDEQKVRTLCEAQIANPKFPDLFKHMTLAIWNKTSRTAGGFEAAFAMALDFLITYGYISGKSSPQRMFMTSKGKKQNMKHAGEPPKKSETFNKFYSKYILGLK